MQTTTRKPRATKSEMAERRRKFDAEMIYAVRRQERDDHIYWANMDPSEVVMIAGRECVSFRSLTADECTCNDYADTICTHRKS